MTENVDGAALGTGWRGFWAWLYPRRIWWAVCAVVVLVVALLGGFRTVDTAASYVELEAGRAYDAGQFDVTVRDARLEPYGSPATADLHSGTPGSKMLIVEADVTNKSSKTAEPQRYSAIDGSGPGLIQAGFAPDRLFNAEEISRIGYQQPQELSVQPGLTNRYAFVWNMPSTQSELGEQLLVQVNRFELHEKFGITEGKWWEPGRMHGRCRLTVGDGR